MTTGWCSAPASTRGQWWGTWIVGGPGDPAVNKAGPRPCGAYNAGEERDQWVIDQISIVISAMKNEGGWKGDSGAGLLSAAWTVMAL